MAEMLWGEKENSDWLTGRSEFLQRGPLRWTAHKLISANSVFNFTAQINSFFVSRNNLTIQENLTLSCNELINACPLRFPRKDHLDNLSLASIYQQIKNKLL